MVTMDAVLLVGFGGPESEAEVMPFLRRVTAGRNVPEQRLALVAEHYLARGGVSPINAQNRLLRERLAAELTGDGLEVYWGNRNSAPWLQDAFVQMADAGVTRAIVVLTSAYSSYSGCRQYRENLADAAVQSIEVLKIPAYYNAPGFVQANLDNLSEAAAQASPDTRILFTTHSIPEVMASTSGPGGGQYVAQHRALAGHLIDALATSQGTRFAWDLVFQSRSGPAHVPWLEPDINDHLHELADAGVTSVIVAPIGFVSDHMEVVQDLDTEAAATAAQRAMAFQRIPTVGVHPAFVQGLADWVRVARDGHSPATDFSDPLPAPCLAGCCPNPRGMRPALCERPA
jgi:ferrochelatase